MSTSEAALGWLRVFAIAAFATATFAFAHELASVPPQEVPRYGLRGKRRVEARAAKSFALLEPLLARAAAWVSPLAPQAFTQRLTVLLRNASEPAGLSAHELLALTLAALAIVGAPSSLLIRHAELPRELEAGLWSLAAWLPIGRVRAAAKQRAKQLERSLPTAMDLCVLCMGAGADFPGALRFVVGELGAAHAVCREELGFVLDELALGRTRVEALHEFAHRTGSVAVREFVASICQSEEKGTPLIEALTIQSTTLRQRRSVRAEELAAQAGVKMMLPLMLLVASLLLIIFGPIITTGTGL